MDMILFEGPVDHGPDEVKPSTRVLLEYSPGRRRGEGPWYYAFEALEALKNAYSEELEKLLDYNIEHWPDTVEQRMEEDPSLTEEAAEEESQRDWEAFYSEMEDLFWEDFYDRVKADRYRSRSFSKLFENAPPEELIPVLLAAGAIEVTDEVIDALGTSESSLLGRVLNAERGSLPPMFAGYPRKATGTPTMSRADLMDMIEDASVQFGEDEEDEE